MVLTDTGFHAKTGDPVNMKVCQRGAWHGRMLVETIFSLLTPVFHGKKVRQGGGNSACGLDHGGVQPLGAGGAGGR